MEDVRRQPFLLTMRLLAFFLALSLLPLAHGTDEQPPAPAERNPAEEKKEKPAPLPPAYHQAIQEAVRRFHARDFDATLARLDEADKLAPANAITLNVRGAIAIERRQFDQGTRLLRDALKLDPKFFPARFNLGEIPFLQKRYAEARQIFEDLLVDDPGNELLLFRIFLTFLLEGNEEAARTALTKIKFPGDTGAYYYAQAAWEFSRGNEPEAQKWIKSGDWVFTREKNIYFADVFYDLGWLKRDAPTAPRP
jgi:tetratricopeptide (TPR) repeat protein